MMNKRKNAHQSGMGFGFEKPGQGDKDEWLTPPTLIARLGAFDLAPCSPIVRPWPTATRHLTIEDDGLKTEWGEGDVRVWLNNPYGAKSSPRWMRKMVEHGNGIALIFARTETVTFDLAWPNASAYLFLARRLKFFHVDGKEGACATSPSVLIASDNAQSAGMNARALRVSGLVGGFFERAVALRPVTHHEPDPPLFS